MEKENRFLPYGTQNIKNKDIEAVVDVLKSGFLTTGPKVEKFETKMSKLTNSNYAISCASGTAGLHLSSLALELKNEDLVVVPSITFLSTANAPRISGGEILFCDVDPETGLMGAEHLEIAIKRAEQKVKAVYVVHLGGQLANLAEISVISKANNISVVEDSCHALGAHYHYGEGKAGTAGDCKFSEMAVFSFHPVKLVTMGEGGCVTTNNEELSSKIRMFRESGMVRKPDQFKNKGLAIDATGAPNGWYYEMHDIGLNYRASDIHCSLGLSQLGELDEFVEKRRSLVELYDELFSELGNELVYPVKREKNCSPAWHLYQVLIDFEKLEVSRNGVMEKLKAMGIGSQVHYIPVHLQPYYQKRYGAIDLPGALSFYSRTLSLPLFPLMSSDDVERVFESLITSLKIRS